MLTKDYTIFKNIEGNRRIVPKHAEKLADAIERKNLLKYCPVLVNENMEVIDGQHRLVAAAKLDYSIYYEVVPGLKLEDVISINTHSRSWSLNDFIDSYIQLGSKHYKELKDFSQFTGITPGLSASLLYGAVSLSGSRLIRENIFKVRNSAGAQRIAEQLNELQQYATFRPKTDRPFITTLVSLSKNQTFDFDRLVAKLSLSNIKLDKRHTLPQYLLQIEEIYNFNSKVKVELYASTQMS